jgi:hypothetical protein
MAISFTLQKNVFLYLFAPAAPILQDL